MSTKRKQSVGVLDNTELLQNYMSLQEEHEQLRLEQEQLKLEHQKLLNEYSENTIIQSMNEMKTRFEDLERNTVSRSTYNTLVKKCQMLIKSMTAASVILDHLSKSVYNQNVAAYKLEMEIKILKEIMEDTIDI